MSLKKLSLFLTLALTFILSFTSARAFDRIFQFPVTPESHTQLIYASELMSFLQSRYEGEVFKREQSRFAWDFNWQQPYLGAGSKYIEREFSIMLWGGFIRATNSNFEMLAATLCHEVGHFIAGPPRQRLENKIDGDWSSAEGQSDWFASSSCLPQVYDHFKMNSPHRIRNLSSVSSMSLCRESKENEKCQWLVETGRLFAEFIHHHFEPESAFPNIQISSLEKPERTLHSQYPTLQCRLDTFRDGALCASLNSASSCQRPRCWYAPNDPVND